MTRTCVSGSPKCRASIHCVMYGTCVDCQTVSWRSAELKSARSDRASSVTAVCREVRNVASTTRSARANAASTPPVSTTRSKHRLLPSSGWITVVAGVESGLDIRHGGQFLPLDVDPLHGIFRLRAGVRDHQRHRLALPARHVDRERVLRGGAHAGDVREHADVRLAQRGHVRCR